MEQPRLSRLTAVLSRGPGLPDGDPRAGIEIELCLDARGLIVAECAGEAPWRVRRFWRDRADWWGELLAVGSGWGVRAGGGDDQPVWQLHGRVLRPGEHITLTRPTDEESVFRIVNIEPLG